MKRTIHPFLFSIYPILSLYLHNIDQTPFLSIIMPLLISVIVTLLLFIFLNKQWRDAGKSGIMVSIILVLFYSYGHLHTAILNLISDFFLKEANFRKINMLVKFDLLLHIILVLAFSLIVLRSYSIIRKRGEFFNLTYFLNIVSIILFIFSIVSISIYAIKAESFEQEKIEEWKTSSSHKERPDIYYIILDGYARSDILKEFYHFENNEFDSFLENKGFYIAKKSHSNYTWTPLSLSSSLNFKYVNYLREKLGKNSKDLRLPYSLIESNKTMHLLRSMGYKYVHFCSTWGATLNNKYADIKIAYNRGLFRDEYFRILIETTMLKIISSLIIDDLSRIHLYAFNKLSTIPEYEEATFTFAHIILPHHPFIFDRNGNVKKKVTRFDQFKSGGWKNSMEYVDQLIFVNKKIMKVVDNILRKSKTEPIIIIQSDHGPQLPGANKEDFEKVRMANYMAYYLPSGGSKYLYQTITPVNTFRIILKHYFNKDFELLKDRVYFSGYSSPYNFEELIIEAPGNTKSR